MKYLVVLTGWGRLELLDDYEIKIVGRFETSSEAKECIKRYTAAITDGYSKEDYTVYNHGANHKECEFHNEDAHLWLQVIKL